MVFRYGGLFLLCVFGAFGLRNLSIFSAFNPGNGIVLTLITYVVLAAILWRFKKCAPIPNVSLSPYPNRSPYITFAKVLLILSALLFCTSMLLVTNAVEVYLALLSLLFFGLFMASGCVTALHFGYFPDTSKGEGVSRRYNPVQFWVTLGLFMLIGLTCVYHALLNLWMLIAG